MPETVYISSTYNDLKDFRRAVMDCVRKLKDYYFSNSMEDYDAEDIHFVKKCTDDVASCDVYILLLGNRYGYLPKGFDKSITEIEYDKAVACQQQTGKPEILVFKVGDLCKAYNYTEQQDTYRLYNQQFLDTVSEQLSPKPFDSTAELELQVAYALMKRVFRQIKTGVKVVAPDPDAVLCFCDRNAVLTSLRSSLIRRQQAKRLFFIQGDLMNDYPGGIVKRFTQYSLGSQSKIESLLSINSLSSSCDDDNSYQTILISTLEHLNRQVSEANTEMSGFIEELSNMKSSKVVLPFSYNSKYDEDFEILMNFLCFLDSLFKEYGAKSRDFELYAFIVNYRDTPDKQLLKGMLEKHSFLAALALQTGKLTMVPPEEILKWIETFITSMALSPVVYLRYFDATGNQDYYMREVNERLNKLIKDLQDGKEEITSII